MWIAARGVSAPGLEDAFRRLLHQRAVELGALGRKYGLRQIRVFQRGTEGFVVFEVEDASRFADIRRDPEFQVLGQEMSSLMNFDPFDPRQFWPEVYSWEPSKVAP